MSRFAMLVNVDHFSPVQIGGTNFVKGIPKEFTNEGFVDILKIQNPDHIVECDADGRVIGEVPAPPAVEPEPRAVRTERDEEIAKDNLRHMQDQERQRMFDGQIVPQGSAVGEDAVEPDSVDIEMPPLVGPPDHPELEDHDEVLSSEVSEAVAATVEPESEPEPDVTTEEPSPEAPAPPAEVATVAVPKKKRGSRSSK